jgi:hypothetical protein
MNGIFFCIVIMIYTLLMVKQLKNINDKKAADDMLSKKIALKILLIFLILCIYVPNSIQKEMTKVDNASNYLYEI